MYDGQRWMASHRLCDSGIGRPADIDNSAGILKQAGDERRNPHIVVDQQDPMPREREVGRRSDGVNRAARRGAVPLIGRARRPTGAPANGPPLHQP